MATPLTIWPFTCNLSLPSNLLLGFLFSLNPHCHLRFQVPFSSSCISSAMPASIASAPFFILKQALFFAIKALPLPQSTTHPSLREKIQQTKNTSTPLVSLCTSKLAGKKHPSPQSVHGNHPLSSILLRIHPFHMREVSGSKSEFRIRNLAKYKKIPFLEKRPVIKVAIYFLFF